MKRTLRALGVLILLVPALTHAQPAQQRPPAVPLIAQNPYFSVWSMADHLTDQNTKHWTGREQPIFGLARIDGKTWRFMGADPDAGSGPIPAMQQTSLEITATRTVYQFQAGSVALTVTFFTPAFPKDLDLLSRPVTYLTVAATAEGTHEVSILIDVDPVIAVNSAEEPVTWGRGRAGKPEAGHPPTGQPNPAALTVLSVGSRDQHPLNSAGDDLRIDWGYFHLAAPDSETPQFALSESAMSSFARTGTLPPADDLDMPRTPREGAAHLAVVMPLGQVAGETVRRHVLLSYTEEYDIEFLDRKLRPYWKRNGLSTQDMLAAAETQLPALEAAGQAFDKDLAADLNATGGPAYAQLAILAYRQTHAAHELAADIDGTPMLFPKENFSGGFISTVDVLYPSAPFYLFFNPALLQAQLKPVMEYAALPRWKWPFAPHDLGLYPLADGQLYGGGELTEEDQMPVEESGNLLLLVADMERELGNADFARQYWPQFTQWAAYLRKEGLDPANQLSTDDFAGHLAHNANLSIKAIEALAAYADLARAVGKPEVAADYEKLAHGMAAQWQTMALDTDTAAGGRHYKLAFDKPGTWSQKYNLVWDQLLDLKLFPPQVRQTELAFYLTHLNRFGLPLDTRADYTKLDWSIWTATLADPAQPAQADAYRQILDRTADWINQGPTRVPLTDWYDTKTGKQMAFQARSVVGGVYIKALADKALAEKWRTRAEP